jgi:lysophospholipase L1-like esterase
MRGHTILQQRIAALGRWAAHRPDLVIVQQTGNDLMDLAMSRASGCGPDTQAATAFESALPEVVKKWRFFRVVQDAGLQIEGTLQGNASSAGRAELMLSPAACEALAVDYVGEVGRLAAGLQKNGASLLVANWEPLVCNAGGDSRWTLDGLAQAKAYATMPLTFVDAHDTLQQGNAMLLPVDAHPSALGHSLFASRLAQRLVGSQVLAHCRH